MCVLEQAQRGPAAARNRGIEAARGAVCLFLGDDTRPEPGLIERHASFHRRTPEQEAALLGHVEWAPESCPSPLMEWLNTGVQFGFGEIADAERVPGSYFYTANVSVKTAFVRAHRGFDEAFPHAAFEDLELGFRLERAGMRLVYDSDAVVEHWHPVDLPAVLTRMRTLGRSAVILHERFPDWPLGRRPGARHRTKAALLTALNLVPLHSARLRHVTWRFLCHEAMREGRCKAALPETSHSYSIVVVAVELLLVRTGSLVVALTDAVLVIVPVAVTVAVSARLVVAPLSNEPMFQTPVLAV